MFGTFKRCIITFEGGINWKQEKKLTKLHNHWRYSQKRYERDSRIPFYRLLKKAKLKKGIDLELYYGEPDERKEEYKWLY